MESVLHNEHFTVEWMLYKKTVTICMWRNIDNYVVDGNYVTASFLW